MTGVILKDSSSSQVLQFYDLQNFQALAGRTMRQPPVWVETIKESFREEAAFY
jgi:hypothetical protein